jgi:phospholipid transport system substrate-binding protein
VREFQSLLVRSYATAYTAYKQVKVDVRPLRMNGNEDDVIVKTQITLPGGAPPVGVDYSMISTRDGWKVYDVTVDGVSLVTTYRNDFTAQVQQGGIDALIRNLQERNAQFTAQGKK